MRQVGHQARRSKSRLLAQWCAFLATLAMSCLAFALPCPLFSSSSAVRTSSSPDAETSATRASRSLVPRRAAATAAVSKPGEGKKLLVLGGNGYVGREVCKLAVARGYQVTSLSRRGVNPDIKDKTLSAVNWVRGDAADEATVRNLVGENDAVVHAIGLLFDVNSGLTNMNIVVSGSGSVPDSESTYDKITRRTAFNVINAVRSKLRMPFSPPTPLAFVSAAEAGWPDVSYGEAVEQIAPEWLREYLKAKRAVEAELSLYPEAIRPVVFRPSLIWSWTKLDVLPIIPFFNLASYLGVPFVDKTVTVTTLSRAIMAGLEDGQVSGVQRYLQMERLEKLLMPVG